MNEYEHPDITHACRTGFPYGVNDDTLICPECSAECEHLYKDRHGSIVGCDECVSIVFWEDD